MDVIIDVAIKLSVRLDASSRTKKTIERFLSLLFRFRRT